MIVCLLAGFFTCLVAQSGSSLPQFVVEPKDVTILSGRTARLECEVTALAENQAVAWMKETTFQTSGRSVLSTDPDKMSRITVEDSKSGDGLHFNLFIHNVRAEDAGVYHCYVVEFWELNQRRWLRSRPATLAVVDVLTPSVRCVQPTASQMALAARSGEQASFGCLVHNNHQRTRVELRSWNGTVLIEGATEATELYNLKHWMDVSEAEAGKLTCLIGFRDETRPGGHATRSCSMGPFILDHVVRNRTRRVVSLVSGTDGQLVCPVKQQEDATPAWTYNPESQPSRFTVSPDGIKITISQVTPQDDGLVFSCRVAEHVVEMEVRVKQPPPEGSGRNGSRSDGPGQRHHPAAAGGSRDRLAPKPVIGQLAWRTLRGRVSSGRLRPSFKPVQVIHPTSAKSPAHTLAPTTSVTVPHSTTTPTPSITAKEDPVTNATATTDTEVKPFMMSPLIIVALCEAGMSLIILIIAFAVLCQCCCRNQTKATVRGDKDLTLATASFGKQSTVPTLLTYKSTTGVTNAELPPKPLPEKKPPDVIYARPESLTDIKAILGTQADLKVPGSWVFSSVNSESGEDEPRKPKDTGNEIYVTMV